MREHARAGPRRSRGGPRWGGGLTGFCALLNHENPASAAAAPRPARVRQDGSVQRVTRSIEPAHRPRRSVVARTAPGGTSLGLSVPGAVVRAPRRRAHRGSPTRPASRPPDARRWRSCPASGTATSPTGASRGGPRGGCAGRGGARANAWEADHREAQCGARGGARDAENGGSNQGRAGSASVTRNGFGALTGLFGGGGRAPRQGRTVEEAQPWVHCGG